MLKTTKAQSSKVRGPWSVVQCLLVIASSGALVVGNAQANDIIKADNASNLNLAASWVTGGPPGSGDTAVVNSTLTAGTSAALGASMSWQGIRVTDPLGALIVTATAGTSLTLGTNGIDMATAQQNLTINSIINLGSPNTWSVGPGRLLTIGGAITNGGNNLTIQGDGNTTITSTNWGVGGLVKNGSGTLTLNRANAMTGNVTLSGGTVTATGGTGFGGVFGKVGTLVIANATLNNASGNNGPFGNPGGALTEGTPANLVPGNVILQSGGVLTIGSSVTAHIPRLLVFSGGELSSSGAVLGTFGSWNLEQGVVVSNTTATSVISALGAIVNQQGGTVFDVPALAASGIDLDVTGYFGHGTSVSDNGFIKKGNGVMRMQGVNTYTGNTIISNGVLRLSGSGSIASSGQILVNTGAKFDVSEAIFALASGKVLGGSGVVTGDVFVASGGRLSPGFGVATLSFSNSLTLSGSTTNIFDLSTNASGAHDKIIVAGDLNLFGVNTINVNYTTLGAGRYKLFVYGGTLTGDTNNLLLANVVSNGRQSVYLDTSVPKEIAMVVAGVSANVRWVGDGVVNNWDANNSLNWFNTGSSTTDVFFNGDAVTFNDAGSKSPDINLAETLQPISILVSNSTGTYTFGGGGNITGGTGLTKRGAGTLVIANSGINDFTGKTAVEGGTLNISSDSALGTAPGVAVTDQLTLSNATLQTTAGFAMNANRGITIGAAGATMDTVSGTVNVPGPISGTGNLTKTGSGTLAVTMINNPYTGKTLINAGTLSMNGITRLGATPTNVVLDQITIDNGAHLLYTAAAVSTSPVQRGFRVGNNGAMMSCNTSGTLAIEGPLTGSGNLTNAGNTATVGTIELDNPTNSFSGDVYTTSGFFRLDDDGQFGTGTLRWYGGGLTANNDRGVLSNYVANPIEMITDFTIRANNSTTDTLERNLVFSTDSIVATGGSLIINNLRTVSNHTFSVWFRGAGFNFAQPVFMTSYTTNYSYLTFGNTNGTTQTFSGFLFGTGGLRRTAVVAGNAGSTILTGDNAYTGGTLVDAGTLLVNNLTGTGTGSGAVIVSAPGTLGGTGAVGGLVSGNGNIAPGMSAGTFTLNAGLDLNSGGTYVCELAANSTNTPGTDYDQISLAGGDLVLGGSSKLQIQFTGSATAPNASNPFWQSPRTWRVVALNGGSNGGATTFGSVVNGSYPAGTFSTVADANGILLRFIPGGVAQPILSGTINGAGTGSATVSWSAQNGTGYRVEYKSDLLATNWNLLGIVIAGGSTASFTDTNGPVMQRFYRVVVQ